MRHILITGASGYVGKAFIKAYGSKYKLRVFGRTPVEGQEFFKGDIKALSDLEKASEGMDVVLHLAAATTDGTGISDEEYFNVNTVGTFNVLEAAARRKVKKVVYCSSVCAVGFRATPRLIMETDQCKPSDGMYGTSKYISEKLCECYAAEHGMKVICLRTAMVVPKHDVTAPANPLARHWLGAVHIDDVVEAFRLAIDNNTIDFDIFHVCADNPKAKFDITKAKKILGFSPRHNLNEITRQSATIRAKAVSRAALGLSLRSMGALASKIKGSKGK
ncbi:MAG: NAD-dependent epimerase/dehydratase family protein [Thermodesulfobacteriota bacterium]